MQSTTSLGPSISRASLTSGSPVTGRRRPKTWFQDTELTCTEPAPQLESRVHRWIIAVAAFGVLSMVQTVLSWQ